MNATTQTGTIGEAMLDIWHRRAGSTLLDDYLSANAACVRAEEAEGGERLPPDHPAAAHFDRLHGDLMAFVGQAVGEDAGLGRQAAGLAALCLIWGGVDDTLALGCYEHAVALDRRAEIDA